MRITSEEQINEYKGYSPEDLIYLYCNCRSLSIMIRGVFVARTRGFQISQRDFLLEIWKPRPDNAELAKKLPAQAVEFYDWLWDEEPLIRKEIERRCEGKKVGAALTAMNVGIKEGYEEVVRFLQLDKITSYRPWESEAGDLKNESVTRLLELYLASTKNYAANQTPEVLFVLNLTVKEKKLCNKLAQIAAAGQEEMIRRFAPILSGEVEKFTESVRDHRREEWRKSDRRREILEGSDDFPADGYESWRANWDFSKTAAANRREDIGNEVHAQIHKPEEYLEEKEEELENKRSAFQAYEYAESRWKERGRAFLDVLKREEGTGADAAKAAGVSREMGQRYKKELKAALSKKSPEK